MRAILCVVSEASKSKQVETRVIRRRQSEPERNEWIGFSPAERIEAVWMLTKLCLAWNNQAEHEPRLQRTLTRVQRERR